MKFLRVLLLVVLVMLLPVRSAWSMAIDCGQLRGIQTTQQAHHASYGDVASDIAQDVAHEAQAIQGDPLVAGEPCGSGAMACASATPMGGPELGLAAGIAVSMAEFPALDVRIARFLASGPDRPPRFI